jgi:hypothetical protein
MTTIVGVSNGLAVSRESGGMIQETSSTAVIPVANLPILWKHYPSQLYQPLCKLLEKFQGLWKERFLFFFLKKKQLFSVWVKLANGDYLVPCLLNSQPTRNLFDVAPLRANDHTIGRVYVIPFSPHGFFSHLLLRMWSFAAVVEYWSSGCVLKEKDNASNSIALVEVGKKEKDK